MVRWTSQGAEPLHEAVRWGSETQRHRETQREIEREGTVESAAL